MSHSEEPKLWMHPRCTQLALTGLRSPAGDPMAFVTMRDGRLLQVGHNTCVTSVDDGATWSDPVTVSDGSEPGMPHTVASLIRARDGTVVAAYGETSTYKWGWDDRTNEPAPDVRCDIWSIRSPDEGMTWSDRRAVFEGFSGAQGNLIETRDGNFVIPIQHLWRDPARHVQFTCVSTDNGRSWQRSNIIDLGGHGHHDGAYEGTVAELSDGRLLMLVRTNFDRFWEAYSDDGGLSWRELRPSSIDASSAPGHLLGLQSGRLALVWNRLYPEGKSSYYRKALPNSERPASYHREELSIAFSEDDGASWSKPIVIGRMPVAAGPGRKAGELAYPYMYERRPGELWVITTRNYPKPPGAALCVSVREEDFLAY